MTGVDDAVFDPVIGGLLEALPDGVAVVAATGEIVAVNAELSAMSGFARDALVGGPIEVLIPARFRAEHVADRMAYVGAGGGRRSMSARADIVMCCADGRELPVDIALSSAMVDADRAVTVASVQRRVAATSSRAVARPGTSLRGGDE